MSAFVANNSRIIAGKSQHLEMLDIRENFEQIIHEKMLALRELAVFIGEESFFATQKGFFTERVPKHPTKSMTIVINVAAGPRILWWRLNTS